MKTSIPPLEEENGHNLPTNVFHVSQKFNLLVSGGQDGTVYLRNLDHLNEVKQYITGHNLKDKGVSALEYSKKYSVVYSGGYDGSFFIWSQEKDLEFNSYGLNFKQNYIDDYVQDVDDDDVDFYKQVL